MPSFFVRPLMLSDSWREYSEFCGDGLNGRKEGSNNLRKSSFPRLSVSRHTASLSYCSETCTEKTYRFPSLHPGRPLIFLIYLSSPAKLW